MVLGASRNGSRDHRNATDEKPLLSITTRGARMGVFLRLERRAVQNVNPPSMLMKKGQLRAGLHLPPLRRVPAIFKTSLKGRPRIRSYMLYLPEQHNPRNKTSSVAFLNGLGIDDLGVRAFALF